MKKVLHISNYYYPHVGGIETTTRNMVNTLKATNLYEQRVICFGDGPNIVDDIPITRIRYLLNFRSQPISLAYYFALKIILYRFKPDLVIIHTPNPLVEHFLNQCRYKGKIIVYHHLDIYRQKILRHLVKPIQYHLKERADLILCHSQQYVDHSQELMHFINKVKILPLCYKATDFEIDNELLDEVRKIRNTYSNKAILFISGRHTKTKGIHLALKAVKNLDGVVLLVGRVGPMSLRIERLIKKTGENVVSLGLLEREQYIKYLLACDYYLFPSIAKNEAFPITLIEVIALGKTPITFTIEGSSVNYISPNMVTGIECPNGDTIKYRDAINELKNNMALRARLSEQGKMRAKELFSYDKFKDSFLKIVEDILTENK